MSRVITVSAGAREGAYDGEDGTFPVTLVEVGEPRTIIPQTGPRAGQEVELTDWAFAIEGAPDDASLVWGSVSASTGPRSRFYQYVTALVGRPPKVGGTIDIDKHLIGRMAHATIHRDLESGFYRIDNLSAMPTRRATAEANAEIVARHAPVAAVADDSLPF